jgi:hypothetical protein
MLFRSAMVVLNGIGIKVDKSRASGKKHVLEGI